MTYRSIGLGIVLGWLIAAATYFNDAVIRQTLLIGNLFPVAVFGPVVLLLLVVNPLLCRLNRAWPLRPAELAVVAAVALAVCGWPGANFFRTFTCVLGLPTYWYKTQSSWQAAQVMSYLPGGSALLGEGHVQNWPTLATKLVEGSQQASPSPAARVWELLSAEGREVARLAAEARALDRPARLRLLRALNDVLHRPDFYEPAAFAGVELPPAVRAWAEQPPTDPVEVERFNRWLLVAAFPEEILPPPAGHGVLLADGRPNAAVDSLVQGADPAQPYGLGRIPWAVWWPTLRLWGGLALLMTLAALCLALIVHPQWAHRELLAYPIAQFMGELTERDPEHGLPKICRSKLFWGGLVVMLAIHVVNGLHAWFPQFVTFPLAYDFGPLRSLFPNAVKVPMANWLFFVRLYPTVIAFAFFLTAEVSFSLGISLWLWVALGSVLIANGIPIENEYIGAKKANMLWLGAYLGGMLTMLYIGRHYYGRVVAAGLGGARWREVPPYAVWAARGLALCVVLAMLLLRTAGLDWLMSLGLIGGVLVIFVMVSRICAETGAFFIQPWWLPVGMLTGLLGMQAIGPTTYLVLAIGSLVLVADPRETWMPYLVNGLRLTDRGSDGAPASRVAGWQAFMLVSGFFVALVATLFLQYRHGANFADMWATRVVPQLPFNGLTGHIAELAANDQLAAATAGTTWSRLRWVAPAPGALLWCGIGMALVIGAALARLRLSWWPIHPVLFMFWGTYTCARFAWSFLLGWLIKVAVVRIAGERSYRMVKPLMVGVIAGELLAALGWAMVGAIYFWLTGVAPKSYTIFPG